MVRELLDEKGLFTVRAAPSEVLPRPLVELLNVVLDREKWMPWINGEPEQDLLRPSPAGSLQVARVLALSEAEIHSDWAIWHFVLGFG